MRVIGRRGRCYTGISLLDQRENCRVVMELYVVGSAKGMDIWFSYKRVIAARYV